MSAYPESAVNSKMDIQKIRRGRKQIAKERNEGIKAEKGKERKEFNKNAIYPNVKEALIEYLTFETRLCNLKEERKKKERRGRRSSVSTQLVARKNLHFTRREWEKQGSNDALCRFFRPKARTTNLLYSRKRNFPEWNTSSSSSPLIRDLTSLVPYFVPGVKEEPLGKRKRKKGGIKKKNGRWNEIVRSSTRKARKVSMFIQPFSFQGHPRDTPSSWLINQNPTTRFLPLTEISLL